MRVPFSNRVPDDLRPNRISAARARLGALPYDLTISNPTACGIAYPRGLLDALARPEGLRYDPDPKGLPAAREAVAAEYRRHGAAVEAERVVLTASTSEAYAFLLKLLCEPGDRVLAPAPSYPLFEHLTRVEGVACEAYHLEAEGGWRLDAGGLAAAPEAVRAVAVVHPNNPTGSLVDPADAAALAALCRRRGWALIADEVFLDYPLDAGAAASFAAGGEALTFALGGLSKSVGLPQLKLAWIVVGGPDEEAEAALAGLEFIADTFLSVSTPVQLALPALLAGGAAVREAIAARCRANLAALRAVAVDCPEVSVPPVAGGWSVPLRIPTVVGEDALVIELLERDGVAVQPGYFFDFPQEGWLVLSLLAEPPVFAAGVARVLARIATLL
jgi:hypothetical protein